MSRVSIITPTFNGAVFLRACVENVAAQEIQDLEHIVVDGGSQDATLAELKALQIKFPHLRFVSEPDRGQSDALNKGVHMAKGEIIGVLNVDDFYEPGAINEAAGLLEADPQLDLIVGACRVLDGEGRTLYWNRPYDLRLECLLLGWSYFEFPGNPSAYFYRKRVHDQVGEYDVADHHAMDLDFILACAEKCRMRFVDRHWGNFRFMPGTKSFEDQPKSSDRTHAIREKYKQRLTAMQRLRMYRLKVQKKAKWTAANGLRRLTGVS